MVLFVERTGAGAHTPLLRVGNVLGENKPELNGQVCQVRGGDIGLDGGRQKDGIGWRRDHEEQDALDERDECPVEDVEHDLGDLLTDDFPGKR